MRRPGACRVRRPSERARGQPPGGQSETPVRRRRVNGMNPSVLIPLANLQRRRRRDTAPRAPVADAGRARRALAEDGAAIAVITQGDLPALTRLADAVSGLADCLPLRRPPASRAVDVINELAAGCTGTVRLIMSGP